MPGLIWKCGIPVSSPDDLGPTISAITVGALKR